MKRTIIAVFTMTIMASCNQTSNQSSTDNLTENTDIMERQEKQKIEALLREYQKSLNTSDAKLTQSLYTKDGIFMPTEAPSGIGSEAILKSYEYVFSQIQLNIEFSLKKLKWKGIWHLQ
ncbi:MAG: hypothetical protein IPL46_26695 [Saprospiraceae bacterium]|nr:hypothetical protein [Saprospiraceae bacterium]